jgi:hypothetical protein
MRPRAGLAQLVSPASSPGKGWTAHYATSAPHIANLTEGSGLVLQVGADLLSTTPAYASDRLAYRAELPNGATQVTVTAAWAGGLPWDPYTVTHPLARAGEVLGPVVGFINGARPTLLCARVAWVIVPAPVELTVGACTTSLVAWAGRGPVAWAVRMGCAPHMRAVPRQVIPSRVGTRRRLRSAAVWQTSRSW